MKDTSFEKFRVYKLAEKLGYEIWAVVVHWDGFARNSIGLQLVRAADSVGANIAEGTGRGSFQDNRRFVRTARASLYEVRHWLRRAHKRKLLSKDPIDRLKPIMDNRAPMLNAYLRPIGTVSIHAEGSGDDASEVVAKDEGPMTKD
jgi:four helix bundle protein